MAGKGAPQSRAGDGFVIHVNLWGMVIFSLALVASAALVTYGLMSARASVTGRNDAPRTPRDPAATQTSDVPPAEIPAWGELRTTEVELEQPEEYIAFEMDTNRGPAWIFSGMAPDKVKALLLSCGLAPGEAERALSPQLMSETPSNTVVRPDDDLLVSLAPGVRSKLYGELSLNADNHYMRFPFHFTETSLDEQFAGSGVDPAIVALMKKLVYARGETECFSDYEAVLRRVPEPERLSFAKALTRQSALLPRLRIRPDTDIDKLLGYWGRGVQVKDVRPLLESLKRVPGGGNISLLYLLPPFARERLYTFPLPGRPDDPAMDCHWSTMNFFNDPPDNHFANPTYTVSYLLEHFYVVAKPTVYGDVVLVLDEQGNAIHSGVYLAGDIIFTKNGNNCSQPWKLMRLKDLTGMYEAGPAMRLAYYREKNR